MADREMEHKEKKRRKIAAHRFAQGEEKKRREKGREYKKRWKAALSAGDVPAAKQLLKEMKGQPNLVAATKPFRGGMIIKKDDKR